MWLSADFFFGTFRLNSTTKIIDWIKIAIFTFFLLKNRSKISINCILNLFNRIHCVNTFVTENIKIAFNFCSSGKKLNRTFWIENWNGLNFCVYGVVRGPSDRINQQLISKRLTPDNTVIYAFVRIYSVWTSFRSDGMRTDVISSFKRAFHDHTQPVLCSFRLISCLTNKNYIFWLVKRTIG